MITQIKLLLGIYITAGFYTIVINVHSLQQIELKCTGGVAWDYSEGGLYRMFVPKVDGVRLLRISECNCCPVIELVLVPDRLLESTVICYYALGKL